MKLKTILVDDHQIVRMGLKQIITDEFAAAEILEAGSAEEAIKIIRHENFDLVITDISMTGRSGIELVKQIRQEFASLPVLVLSMHSESQYAVRALKAGASGYLSKDSASLELITAIKQILSGRKYISATVGELLLESFSSGRTGASHEMLSDREFEVLKLLGAGKSISAIGEELSLGVTTVSTYRSRILDKMNFQNNSDIVRYVIENRIGA